MTAAKVEPSTIPELAVVLRTPGMRSKVRQFDLVCEADHRLVEVLRIAKRPLALGIDKAWLHGGDGPKGRWLPDWRYVPTRTGEFGPDRRGGYLGLWLDVPDETVETVNGPQVMNRYTFACWGAHCAEPIFLPWLRKQLTSGKRRCVITDAIRYAMR